MNSVFDILSFGAFVISWLLTISFIQFHLLDLRRGTHAERTSQDRDQLQTAFRSMIQYGDVTPDTDHLRNLQIIRLADYTWNQEVRYNIDIVLRDLLMERPR